MWKTIVSSSSCCNVWSSKSTLSVLSTKSVKPESCWKRTGGSIGKVELTHRSYFSNFNDCYCILYFRLFSEAQDVGTECSFCHVPSYLCLPSSILQSRECQLPALTMKLWKAISMAHHTSRADETMESAQIFYQHGRRGWASNALT